MTEHCLADATVEEGPVKHYLAPSGGTRHVVVVGSGPVGVRFTREFLEREPSARLTLFGNEPTQPYNRVQLSALLAGEVDYEEILSRLPATEEHPGFTHTISAIESIDTASSSVTDTGGRVYPYDVLVLATGSRPSVPQIPGVDQTGVYTFRRLKDAEALSARVSRSRHIVVVGGGLLGLEAARALLRFNTDVTVVQQGPHLMDRQLDEEAGCLLQTRIEALGISVVTNSGVRLIEGEGRVTGVVTRDGERIACDTVLLCAGIRANLEMARAARIRVGRGIVVDDTLQTSVPNVYAVGECCEHRGQTYGLVNPGFEQASVAAEVIARGRSRYLGSFEISRLKVVGESVCSMGEVDEQPRRPFQSVARFRRRSNGAYRKLVTYRGRLTGAVGFGEWQESRRIQEAFQQERRVWPWQMAWFRLTGRLWLSAGANRVTDWSADAIVCQCNHISQGALVDALEGGACSVEQLGTRTGAGTVCGSCKPLLAELVGEPAKAQPERGSLPLMLASLMALLIAALVIGIPALTTADSVQTKTWFEGIWNDQFWKQVSGFTLLGLSLLGLLMSMRKRLRLDRLGDFTYWRLLHGVLGLLCVVVLVAHTGFHLGNNLNRFLIIDFLAVLAMGALAGLVIALSRHLSLNGARRLRRFWTWAHILVAWPLPVLLGAHILTVYYF